MTETNVYQRGETIPIWAENRDWAGTLTNPSEGVTITLYEPDGTLAKDKAEPPVDIDDVAMGKETPPVTGRYVYYYEAASDDPQGWWHYFCKATDGTKIVITHGSFKLN